MVVRSRSFGRRGQKQHSGLEGDCMSRDGGREESSFAGRWVLMSGSPETRDRAVAVRQVLLAGVLLVVKSQWEC